MRWYLKAANLGYAPAQRNLAGMYGSGRGVAMNVSFARYWFTEAAKNLHARAPALMSKSVFGLCVSQRDDLNMDNKPDIDFAQHLEKQFQILRTEPLVKEMPGVAIYAFYRMKPEFVPVVNSLVQKYLAPVK